jgi:hypothetical protein
VLSLKQNNPTKKGYVEKAVVAGISSLAVNLTKNTSGIELFRGNDDFLR